jgi:hypothetical protein
MRSDPVLKPTVASPARMLALASSDRINEVVAEKICTYAAGLSWGGIVARPDARYRRPPNRFPAVLMSPACHWVLGEYIPSL